ncbi:MAG: DUF4268 domain-containing protein [Pseudomonadota bacterium]
MDESRSKDQKLGRIERVELRSIWTSEDKHFTPWLAQPENLEILGETLGIELEFEAQEKDVGPFRADILCKNTAEKDSWVVIENQIEKTDHKHLGQLLTYASGLKASTIVWISAVFGEEHRAALDWLNQLTDKSVRFFGLEIELWKIGDSQAAPRFNIVCQPNDWQNTVRDEAEKLTGDAANRSQNLRIKYWSAFRSYLQEKKSKLRPQKPSRDHWYTFGIGTSHAHTAALLITRENKIAVQLNINSEDAKSLFNELIKQKDDIETIIGSPLDWREMPDKKSSRIVLFNSVDPYDEKSWTEQFDWLQNKLEKFDKAFRPLFANKIGG